MQGRPQATAAASSSVEVLSVGSISDRYLEHARVYYRHADGTPTTEVRDIRLSLRELLELYGTAPAESFGLCHLKAVREAMLNRPRPLCRKVTNQRVGRILRLFRWAASEELIPAHVSVTLDRLVALKPGRSRAIDHPPRQPAKREAVEKALHFVSPVLRAMACLEAFTGMRPGEIVAMRRDEIDTTQDPWPHVPRHHKTKWRGHTREIFFGENAQKILAPFMDRPGNAFLFSPIESRAWWSAKRRAERRTPMTPSQRARRPKANPSRAPRDHFTVQSYDRAIARACKRARVERWTPNQLRHWAATRIEDAKGIEPACAAMGHRSFEITYTYAKARREIARRVAREMG